jgi:hypothetical protein
VSGGRGDESSWQEAAGSGQEAAPMSVDNLLPMSEVAQRRKQGAGGSEQQTEGVDGSIRQAVCPTLIPIDCARAAGR